MMSFHYFYFEKSAFATDLLSPPREAETPFQGDFQ
jgi:hypothetical protein